MASDRSTRFPPSSERLPAVDGLRGALALVVVVNHFAQKLGSSALFPAADFAVCVFFLLSGYVLTRGWDGRYGVFLARRFVRLWPVYALCLAAGYAIERTSPTWSQFFWFPLLNANSKPAIDPPIWSLCIEAWAMPFMPIIVWAGRGRLWRPLAGVAIILAAGEINVKFLFGVFFLAGAFLSRFPFRNRLLQSAIPQWLGRVSYSLYLSHWLALSLGEYMGGRLGVMIATPIAFLVAWAIWRWIEAPSIRLSRQAGALFAAPARAAAGAIAPAE